MGNHLSGQSEHPVGRLRLEPPGTLAAVKLGVSGRVVRITPRQDKKLVEFLQGVFADPDLELDREDKVRRRPDRGPK